MIKRIIAVAAVLTLCVACSKKDQNQSSAKGKSGDDKTAAQKPGTPTAGTPGGDNVNGKQKQPSAAHKAFDEECRQGLEKAKELLPQLLTSGGERTVMDTLELYNELSRQLNLSRGSAGLFSEVHPDETIRELARVVERDVQEFVSKMSLNKQLYDVFAGLDVSGWTPRPSA